MTYRTFMSRTFCRFPLSVSIYGNVLPDFERAGHFVRLDLTKVAGQRLEIFKLAVLFQVSVSLFGCMYCRTKVFVRLKSPAGHSQFRIGTHSTYRKKQTKITSLVHLNFFISVHLYLSSNMGKYTVFLSTSI